MKRKNIFKSLLAAAMALIMIFGAAPLSGFVGISLPMLSLKAEAATTEDGLFEYAVDRRWTESGYQDGVSITRCDKNVSGKVVIPETIEGYKVKWVDNYAFSNCENLTEITIPDSVTEIDYYAFYNCTSLSKVQLPNGLTKIGYSAFSGCTSLTEITIPDSVTQIEGSAFSGCTSLKELTIPDSVTEIGNYAFDNCTSLSKAQLSNGLTKIGDSAFRYCENLTELTIPDSVTGIGGGAFSGCTSLAKITVSPDNKNYSSVDGVLFSKDMSTLLVYPAGSKRSTYIVPDSVTEIGSYAFDNCTTLSKVQLPNGLTKIGNSAFFGCTSLTELTIPDGVTEIGDNTFSGCTSLSKVKLPNSLTKIGYYAFRDCENLTELTIPDSVTEIGYGAFYHCTSLSKVQLSNGLTKIGDYAFRYCTSLTEITIPDGVTEIGDNAFGSCTSLSKVKLPNALNKIGRCAFEYCISLTGITIPDGVTEIGADAFYYCTSLAKVNLSDDLTKIGNRIFFECKSLGEIAISKNVAEIGKLAFYGCTSLTKITVSPDNENYISVDGVLFSKDMSTLLAYPAGDERSTYTVPDNVTEIGEGALSGCVYLDDIIVSPNNESYSGVDGVLFTKDMSTLLAYPAGNERKVYTVPVGVSVIDVEAFFGCMSLEKIIISDGVKKIGVFAHCKNLKEIVIPDSVADLLSEIIVVGCYSLTNIIVSPGNKILSSSDGVLFFNDEINLLITYPANNERSTYTVPDGVEIIYVEAFAHSRNLKEVIMPDSVMEIYTAAFMYCTSLLKVKLSKNLTKIGMWTFYSCTNLREITIPKSVVEIETSAFENCDNLKNVYYLGTRTQWQNMVIGAKNEALTRATVHCIDDPPCDHVWGEWEVVEEATYEKDGFERRACSLCNIEETRVIPKLVKATAIELSDSEKAVLVGDTFTIAATVKPDDAYNRTVIWSSSNPSVATVDENGNVTAIALGKAVITAESADGAKAECKIIVDTIFKYKLVPSQTGSESSYTVTITGYKKPLSGEITIPETIEGYEVTAIGRDAFSDCTEITSIVMPDSVTEIGSYAFSGCTSLSKIILPKGLKEIAVGIFCNCSALESISVPEGVTVIGDFAFTNCSDLKQVNLPSGLITIGSYRHSEGASFEGCSSLKEITIPDSVIMIENASFSGCSSLKEITIPDSVKVIGYATFSECTNLESVTIGSGVEQLDVDAFFKYSNAPVSCRRLANIIVSPENKTYSSVDGVLFNKDKSELLAYPIGNKRSSYTIPDGVTKIDQKAFYGCRYIETLTIPASVKEIEDSALGNCYDIRTINYLGTREQWKEVIIGADNYMFALVNVGCADDNRCDHVWGEWVVVDAATTEKEGLEKRVCSLCSAEETRKIPKLDIVKVTAIELSDSERTATVGTSFTITATVKPDDALNRTIIWSSSDPSIATVDENGTVTAIAEGEAIITAESADGVTAECKVTVEKKESFGKKLLNVITAPFRAIINLFKKLLGK